MDNVIRPSFGGRQQPAGAEPPAYEDGYQPLYVYGQAAGHLVALIEDASGLEGLVLKVVVGPAAGNSIKLWPSSSPPTRVASMPTPQRMRSCGR